MKQTLHSKQKLALRIAGYTASAGALLALNPVVKGEVVYSGIQNIPLFMPSDYYDLDIDGDLTPDFAFRIYGVSTSYMSGPFHVWIGYGFAGIYNLRTDTYKNSWITRLSTFVYYTGTYYSNPVYYYYPIVDGLGAGIAVDAAQPLWSNVSYPSYAGALGSGVIVSYTGPYSGSYAYGWGDFFGQERYIGVRFYIGAEQHYGWIRASLGEYIDPMILIDWAYEDTPGVGILTGAGDDTGPIAILDAGIAETLDQTVEVDLSFNERAYAFDETDIEVTNGALIYFEILEPGFHYLIVVTADAPGEVIVTLPEARVYDMAGNPNVQASTSWIYSHIDNVNTIAAGEIKIFPNPVSNELHVELPVESNIKITSMNGTILYSKENMINENIDVGDFSPGIYILEVNNNKGVSQHQVVIQ